MKELDPKITRRFNHSLVNSELTNRVDIPKLGLRINMAEDSGEIQNPAPDFPGLKDKIAQQAREAAEKLTGRAGVEESTILSQLEKIGIPQEIIKDPIFQEFAKGFAKELGSRMASLNKGDAPEIIKRFQRGKNKLQEQITTEGDTPKEPAGGDGGGEPPPEDNPPTTDSGGEGENGEGGEEEGGSGKGEHKNVEDDLAENVRLRMLMELMIDSDIKKELASSNPNFNKPELRKLRDFFEHELNPTTDEFEHLLKIISKFNRSFVLGVEQDRYGRISPVALRLPKEIDPKEVFFISEASSKVLFEWSVEKIIGHSDQAPEVEYTVGSWEIQSLLDRVRNLAFVNYGNEYGRYTQSLIKLRGIAHELNRSLSYGESYKENIVKAVNAYGLDFILNEVAGVSTTFQILERVASNKVAENRIWWSQEEVNQSYKETEMVLNRLFESGELKQENRMLTVWEKDRALVLAKILHGGIQRTAMYASIGDLPPMADIVRRISSVPHEYIARSLVALKIIGARFFMIENSGSKEYLKKVLKIIKDEDKEGEWQSLFGLNIDTVILNSYGGTDMLSHGWRSHMEYFSNIPVAVKDESGAIRRRITLLEYMNEQSAIFDPEKLDPTTGGGDLGDGEKKDFSDKMEDHILRERLYLSALIKHGYLTKELKAKLWKKRAVLSPSAIAALLPHLKHSDIVNSFKESRSKGGDLSEDERETIRQEDDVWNSLKIKLFTAEAERVQEEWLQTKEYKELVGRMKKEDLTDEEKQVVVARISGIEALRNGELETFNRFLEKGYTGQGYSSVILSKIPDLEESEKKMLEKIINGGIENAEKLAGAKMSYTYSIDDAPVINMQKTGEGSTGIANEDILRLLISDQENLGKANGALSGLVENPGQKKASEAWHEFVKGWGIVHGRVSAQGHVEPFVQAWYEMAKIFDRVKYIPGLSTIKNMQKSPRSEMEMYFRNSQIAFDEQDISNGLEALAQDQVLSDNVAKGEIKAKPTQLQELKNKLGSDRMRLLLRMLRIWSFIFPAAFIQQVLKTVIPSTKELSS